MDRKQIETVKQLISSRKVISIIPHKNPDGDAMGSTLALYHYLRKKHSDVRVVSPNTYPEFLQWLPGNETVLVYDKNPEEARQRIVQSQLIFTLDFNALSRADALLPYLEASSAGMVMIDHHQNPEPYAQVSFSDPIASSTCEMVYEFILAMGDEALLDKDIATCLYTGIMTDTGSFCHSNTSSQTLKIAACLMERGADNVEIYNRVYNSNSFNRLKLLGFTLSEFRFLKNYRTAYTVLSSEDLERFSFHKGDTEGFVNYGLSIEDADLAVILIAHKGEENVRFSFRSKQGVDVNRLARTYFNGGGHIQASGGSFKGTIQEAERYFLEVLPRFFNQE